MNECPILTLKNHNPWHPIPGDKRLATTTNLSWLWLLVGTHSSRFEKEKTHGDKARAWISLSWSRHMESRINTNLGNATATRHSLLLTLSCTVLPGCYFIVFGYFTAQHCTKLYCTGKFNRARAGLARPTNQPRGAIRHRYQNDCPVLSYPRDGHVLNASSAGGCEWWVYSTRVQSQFLCNQPGRLSTWDALGNW